MSQPLLASLFEETERRPVSVSELTAEIRGTLEKQFGSVWVEGEVSNFRVHTSGHWYLTLKDQFAQLRAACYRSSNQRIRFRLEDGLLVRARGRLTLYEPKGEYQLIIEALEPVGAGALQLAFTQTKARLEAEGLFAAELKRPLPMFPRRVGVVTSANGAAIRDIVNVISRRTQTVHILLAPARVQGDGASHEIVRAIRFLNEHHRRAISSARPDDGIDVMIVGRGGGSIEDLWAFNEENVARAIRSSAIPVISAVGHETDFTIADFVADLRAATPSAAAEMVATHEQQLCARLSTLTANLARSIRYRIAGVRNHVQRLALSNAFDLVAARVHDASTATTAADFRLHTRWRAVLEVARRRAATAAQSLSPVRLRSALSTARAGFESLARDRDKVMLEHLNHARQRFAMAAGSLDAMSPLRVLERGYAIAQDKDGRVVRDSASVAIGDELSVRLWRGSMDCRVEGTTND